MIRILHDRLRTLQPDAKALCNREVAGADEQEPKLWFTNVEVVRETPSVILITGSFRGGGGPAPSSHHLPGGRSVSPGHGELPNIRNDEMMAWSVDAPSLACTS